MSNQASYWNRLLYAPSQISFHSQVCNFSVTCPSAITERENIKLHFSEKALGTCPHRLNTANGFGFESGRRLARKFTVKSLGLPVFRGFLRHELLRKKSRFSLGREVAEFQNPVMRAIEIDNSAPHPNTHAHKQHIFSFRVQFSDIFTQAIS